MKQKGIIAFVAVAVLILVITTVTASSVTYPKGITTDIKIPCLNNDTSCSPSATCNVSISYPNGTSIVKDAIMTNSLQYFNYTLDGSQMNQLGRYQYIAICQDGGSNGYSLDSFEVTSTGATNEFWIDLILFIFIGFAIFLFIFGINKGDAWITLMSSFLFIFAGFWIYYNPIFYLPDFINLALSFITWGFGAYILLKTAYELADTG